jgi:hypothetical protein
VLVDVALKMELQPAAVRLQCVLATTKTERAYGQLPKEEEGEEEEAKEAHVSQARTSEGNSIEILCARREQEARKNGKVSLCFSVPFFSFDPPSRDR